MEPHSYIYDDELQSATPAKQDKHEADYDNSAPQNPFYFIDATATKEEDSYNASRSEYPRERRNTTHTQIVTSPDMAINNKKNARAKTGNPMLQKLSRAWGHEDAKSEIPIVKQNSIDKSMISLPPGTPKSVCTLHSKNLNQSINTTLSVSNIVESKPRKSSFYQAEKSVKLEPVLMQQSIPDIPSISLERNPQEISENSKSKASWLGCCKYDNEKHLSIACCIII